MDEAKVAELVNEAVRAAVAPLVERMEELLKNQQSEYVSIKRAARITELSADHIRRAVTSGRLPASNRGTAKKPLYRIAKTDLNAWMEQEKGGKQLPPRSQLRAKMKDYLPGVAV